MKKMVILLMIRKRKMARNRKAYTRFLCDCFGWESPQPPIETPIPLMRSPYLL